ncbi:MAG: PSD1 and planctomycete cytochrome C domain-containing protein [Planctomycetales bacterium]
MLSVFLTQLSGTPVGVQADDTEGLRLFRERIEPVLKVECYGCHSDQARKVQGGLRLDLRSGLLDGGDGGPVIVPGQSGESLLLKALRHEEGLAMPPKKPRLSDQTIADFARWIDLGAPDPRDGERSGEPPGLEAARQHWAFQPIRKQPLPDASPAQFESSAIDRFIRAKLEERGWQPAPEASRREWLRRVTFGLTGLPPTPEEVVAFEGDASAEAYERVADRLLASVHYGEHWGQHWLDVVRFAETEGYEYDRHIPDAWRFRDYVIDSLNRDKPFDRFVSEQVAGDELGPDDPECLTASIFHRLGPVRRNAGNPDIALSRNEVLTERTDILGTAFLGLTIGCARCHNHKLEPISQKDYYRLQAYLSATEEHNVVLASVADQDAWNAQTQAIKDQMQAIQQQARLATGAERIRLTQMIEELEDRLPAPLATIPATHNVAASRTPIHVLRRGVWENKGEPVGPRPPAVLEPRDVEELPADVDNPRTRLAAWLVSPENPLTARVIVNRLWQQHFGIGLVKSANDFGLKGDRPSHPELLDTLAATFIEQGWRLKPLHRQIVLSRVYRQSSRAPRDSEAARLDPENRLLWRFSRRRLSAEEIRDAMLAVSGRLNPRMGGPSVMLPVDPELVGLLYKPSQWAITPAAEEHDRRSVYLIAKRNLRLPFLESLDAPALLASCARRESSTHPPQALELLNGALSNELAEALARRLEAESGSDSIRLVDRAYELALGRLPVVAEREAAIGFLRDQPLSELALALFNLNEFLYVP